VVVMIYFRVSEDLRSRWRAAAGLSVQDPNVAACRIVAFHVRFEDFTAAKM
jgi:hypothetical protein